MTIDQLQKQTVVPAPEEQAKEFGFAVPDLFSDVIGKLRGLDKGRGASRAPLPPKHANPAYQTVTGLA